MSRDTVLAAELPTIDNPHDPRVWLESIDGDKALDWVRENNVDVLKHLGNPTEQPVYKRILAYLDSKKKITYVGRVLDHGSGYRYYNVWTDNTHKQGLWRRCMPDEYQKKEPQWETVLDLDALSKEEGMTWVWAGSVVPDLEADDGITKRVLIKLSAAGADAVHVREFDLEKKTFVPAADGGFVLEGGKTIVSWKDRDTLLVGGTLLGPDKITASGYARTTCEWLRGTPLSSAVEVFAGMHSDVQVAAYTCLDRAHRFSFRMRCTTFYDTAQELLLGPEGFGPSESAKGYRTIRVPDNAQAGTHADQLILTLRSEWLGYKSGTLLAAPAAAFLDASDDEAIKALLTPIFEPTDRCTLEGAGDCKSFLILHLLNNVRSELRFWSFDQASGAWSLHHTIHGQGVAQISMQGVHGTRSDELFATSSSYTLPTTLSSCHAQSPSKQSPLKSLPVFFDAAGLQEEQYEATSLDGTKVPYFLVSRTGAPLDGSTPTLLYGYGGFELNQTPGYSATVGVAWLEKGYAYAVACTRGGAEFGPSWHQAGRKQHRHRVYEDFEAVAKDLVARGVTSHERLGVEGGSNGGMLTGNMITRSPELFGAIISEVPLLDMRRYTKLLAGASWVDEYGDPRVAGEWDFLRHNSPYHTLRAGAHPTPTLVTTSTRDDRVHPAHARKLVGKMYDLGLPVLSYENIEGGHGGAANSEQRAFMSTLTFTFLEKALAERSLAPTLAKRAPRDGGRRTLANWLYFMGAAASTVGSLRIPRPPAKWVAAALALAAAVALRPRLRLR